jgi:HK97 gp10 family phage protein
MEIEITGLTELEKKLTGLEEKLTEALSEALDEIAGKIRDDARDLAPVDTGALRRSIRTEKKGKLEVLVIAGGGGVTNPRTGREVDYAGYVEYGTSRMSPQPYMRPALEKNLNLILRIVKEKVLEVLG